MDVHDILDLAATLQEIGRHASQSRIYTVFVANGSVAVKEHSTKQDLIEYSNECLRLAMADRYGQYRLLVFYGVRWPIKRMPFRIETGGETLFLEEPQQAKALVDGEDGNIGGVMTLQDMVQQRQGWKEENPAESSMPADDNGTEDDELDQ